ncbi:MAG: ATP-dependent Clp protease ATP-binding subunit [Clostridiales bacterium]|nr:ATP-dependent Clp protease ATP-binding subunit [Clostridiales bacterium]
MKIDRNIYSEDSLQIFQVSYQFAVYMKHGFMGSEHMLWALAKMEGVCSQVLQRFGVDGDLIEEYIRKYDHEPVSTGGTMAVQISGEMDQVLLDAESIGKERGHERIELADIFLGILSSIGTAGAQLLHSLGVDIREMRDSLLESETAGPDKTAIHARQEEKEEEILAKYAQDMTGKARAGEYDPVIGREDVVERMIQILSRRTKNNPVLTGEPGVGKTAVVEGLAWRIAQGQVPENLKNKRLLSLDLTGMLAGTRFRGDFEERMQAFLEAAQKAGDVLLFMDELHTLVGAGAGSGDSMDAANILKPVLARGSLQIIGATTLKEYRRHIEKDAALERRFQPVSVEEPSSEEAVAILMGLRKRYEDFHELRITDEAVRAAVELSDRYISDRFLPDKAVDLMDEAASRIRTRRMTAPDSVQRLEIEIRTVCAEKKKAAGAQEYERAAVLRDRQQAMEKELREKQEAWKREQDGQVTAEDVAAVVSAWTGIPVTMLTQEESQRLRSLEETLHRRVIGQEDAVSAVAKAVRRGRTGAAEPGRPIGSFLFLGPTGVGKTELCRALAEVLFQDETAMIRLDMSEYMEHHTVSRLFGSPPGYVGYDEGGQLTEMVRKKPYSIVLLDEIEKAHPDVWNALLQVLDDGRLTDSQGRTVSFKNTIVVMTSNVGARDIQEKRKTLGFLNSGTEDEGPSGEEVREKAMDAVKKTFQPEFLNRLDEVIVFQPLTRENIREIAGNQLKKLEERMRKQGVPLVVDDSAVDFIAEKGYDPVYGARPVKRAIQTWLQNAVADRILEGGFSEEDKVVAVRDGEKITVKVQE